MNLAIEKFSKMTMKGSRTEPKGSQMATRMTPKPIQNDPRTSNWPSHAKLQFWDRFWMRLGTAQGSTLVPKSGKAPWKSYEKIYLKSDVEKVVIFIRKSSEIDAKIAPKCRTHRNLRFLYFCKEYNVKIVFYHPN